MASLLETIPAPIRSLWKAEVELRRGLWASILNRREPNPHYDEARRHFNEAFQTMDQPLAKTRWGRADDVATPVEEDRVAEPTDKDHNPDSAARF